LKVNHTIRHVVLRALKHKFFCFRPSGKVVSSL
jgi:hypothetical protein